MTLLSVLPPHHSHISDPPAEASMENEKSSPCLPTQISVSSSSSDALGVNDPTARRPWSTAIKENTIILLRALGFSLVTSLLKLLRPSNSSEAREHIKVAVQQNRKIALLRALIHVVPVGVALAEIILNLCGHNLNPYPHNLGYYQYAAKAHEVTIQASITAVIFAYIRNEVALGKGLPFGYLSQGLQVTQISSLWSTEFWGSLSSKHLSLAKRIHLVLLTVLCVMVAVLGGPSSAVLLIPRLGYWPGGSTGIWINATAADIWPDRLDASLVSENCSQSSETSISSSCPGSEWQSILRWLELTNHGEPAAFTTAIEQISNPPNVPITGQGAYRQLAFVNGDHEGLPVGYNTGTMLSTAAQSVISDALLATADLLGFGKYEKFAGRDYVYTIAENYYQPYTATSCAYDVIQGPSDKTPIYFPIPQCSKDPEMLANAPLNRTHYKERPSRLYGEPSYLLSIADEQSTRLELFKTPETLMEHRIRWVELPQTPFNGSTIGAIILLPRSPFNTTQEMLVCNIGGGWGSSQINMTRSLEVVTSMLVPPSIKQDPAFQNLFDGTEFAESEQAICNLPIYPPKVVTVSEEWASYLSPFVPSLNTTVINLLMNSPLLLEAGLPKRLTAQSILSAMVANGLARTAFTGQIQGTLKMIPSALGDYSEIDASIWDSGRGDVFSVDPEESKDWIKLHVEELVETYAYNSRGVPTHVAIAVLLTYCLLASMHLLYAGVSGISSTSWDSFAEMMALAVNSMPTEKLRNTCAGISKLHVYKLPVRIMSRLDGEGEGEHLELVFDESDEDGMARTAVKKNRAYGTLPWDLVRKWQ